MKNLCMVHWLTKIIWFQSKTKLEPPPPALIYVWESKFEMFYQDSITLHATPSNKHIKIPPAYNTSDTSKTYDTIRAYPLAINHIRFYTQLHPQEGSYHQPIMEEYIMPDGPKSR